MKHMEYTEYRIAAEGYNSICRKYNRNVGVIGELVGYELTNGYNLYLVKATYAKSLTPSKYYIVAPNAKIAKNKFKNIYTWLNIISSVEIVEGDFLEWALSHPKNVSIH